MWKKFLASFSSFVLRLGTWKMIDLCGLEMTEKKIAQNWNHYLPLQKMCTATVSLIIRWCIGSVLSRFVAFFGQREISPKKGLTHQLPSGPPTISRRNFTIVLSSYADIKRDKNS